MLNDIAEWYGKSNSNNWYHIANNTLLASQHNKKKTSIEAGILMESLIYIDIKKWGFPCHSAALIPITWEVSMTHRDNKHKHMFSVSPNEFSA